MNNLLAIGGFIVFFAVLMQVLSLTGIIEAIIGGISRLLPGADPHLLQSLTIGLGEITLGSQSASLAPLPLETRIALVGAILGWSGLAIQAQVASMVADTDIRLGPFWIARLAQAVLSGFLLYLFFRFGIFTISEPVWSASTFPALAFGNVILYSSRLLLIGLLLMLLLGLASAVVSQVRRSL